MNIGQEFSTQKKAVAEVQYDHIVNIQYCLKAHVFAHRRKEMKGDTDYKNRKQKFLQQFTVSKSTSKPDITAVCSTQGLLIFIACSTIDILLKDLSTENMW